MDIEFLKSKIKMLKNPQVGSFAEFLVLNYYRGRGLNPQRINKHLMDLKVEGRQIDVKTNRRALRRSIAKAKFSAYQGRRHDCREYEQVIFFDEEVVLVTEMPQVHIAHAWAWNSINDELENWEKTRKKSSANLGAGKSSKLSPEMTVLLQEALGTNKVRSLKRGEHNRFNASRTDDHWRDVIHNSYPTEGLRRKFSCTVFVQFLCDQTESIEHIVAYPHKNIDEVLGNFLLEAPQWIKNKGRTHVVNYKRIIREKHPMFFYENIEDLRARFGKSFVL